MVQANLADRSWRNAGIAKWTWPWLKITEARGDDEEAAAGVGGGDGTPPGGAAAAGKGRLAPAPTAGNCIILSDKLPVVNEWSLYSFVKVVIDQTPANESRTGAQYDRFVFKVSATRRPWRMAYSKAVPSFLIVCCAFAAESLAPTEGMYRLEIVITLLLSAVVLHTDVSAGSQELTLLTKYSLACLGVLVAAVLEVAIANALLVSPWAGDAAASLANVDEAAVAAPHGNAAYTFDFIAWQVLLIGWVALNAYFLGRVRALHFRNQGLKRADAQHTGDHAAAAEVALRHQKSSPAAKHTASLATGRARLRHVVTSPLIGGALSTRRTEGSDTSTEGVHESSPFDGGALSPSGTALSALQEVASPLSTSTGGGGDGGGGGGIGGEGPLSPSSSEDAPPGPLRSLTV